MSDIAKLLGLLNTGEVLLARGKRAAELAQIAEKRIAQKKCAICGDEDTIEGMPLGPSCAKRGAGGLIDLIGKR